MSSHAMSIEFALTIPIAIVSTVIAILTVATVIFILLNFVPRETGLEQDNKPKTSANTSDTRSNSTNISNTSSTGSKSVSCNNGQKADSGNPIQKYFKYSSLACVTFNALCSLCNAAYCILLIADPSYDDNSHIPYFQHPSFVLRIASTYCWLGGAISLIWFFNGRLFYAFKGSVYAASKLLFVSINVFVTSTGIILFSTAFYGVYRQNVIIQELSFNSFRIIYQIITFSMLFMFSRRLLLLTIQERTVMSIVAADIANSNDNTVVIHTLESEAEGKKIKPLVVDSQMLDVTVKNAALVSVTSTSVFLVTMCYTAFRFFLSNPTRLTLLIPMNMASIDALVNNICVIMLFPFGNTFYSLFCCCHKCFKKVCVWIANEVVK